MNRGASGGARAARAPEHGGEPMAWPEIEEIRPKLDALRDTLRHLIGLADVVSEIREDDQSGGMALGGSFPVDRRDVVKLNTAAFNALRWLRWAIQDVERAAEGGPMPLACLQLALWWSKRAAAMLPKRWGFSEHYSGPEDRRRVHFSVRYDHTSLDPERPIPLRFDPDIVAAMRAALTLLTNREPAFDAGRTDEVIVGPDYWVICSQADVARALDRSPNTPGLLGLLAKEGTIELGGQVGGSRRKNRVHIANPDDHATLMERVAKRRKS